MVFALIAVIAVFAVPAVSNHYKLNLNSTAREMASVVKEGYNATVVTRQINRVVYDFEKGEYWVESGPSDTLLDAPENQDKDFKRESVRNRRSADRDKDKNDTGAAFAMNRLVTRSKKSLPSGVEFEDVITARSRDPITKGKAYTHFFPHGAAEKTIIHLKDSSNHQISLVIQPLIGKTRLMQGHVTEKEAYEE